MKNILSSFLLIFLLINIFFASFVSADVNKKDIIKSIESSKQELKKIKKGESYISAIDSFVDKSDKDKLEKIKENISRLLSKNTFEKDSDTLVVISYLQEKVDLSLYEINANKTTNLENKTKIDSKDDITEQDKEKVRVEIIKLQKKLLDKSKNIVLRVTEKLEDNLNLEQEGDFELSTNFDYSKIGSFNYKLLLEDYLVKSNSSFDSSLKGKLKSFFYYNFNEDLKNKNLDFSANLEQISKGGDYYIALKNFNMSEKEGFDDSEKFLDILEKLGENPSFVKVTENDKDLEGFYNFLSFFGSKKYLSSIGDFEKKPLFELYAKSENKYLLKPTKFACEKYKDFSDVFDPFNGVSCSSGQYEKMLDNFGELGDLYLEFDEENITLAFKGNLNQVLFDSYIKYNNSNIQEFKFHVEPTNEKYEGEYITLKYIRNNTLNFSSLVDGSTVKFNSTLDFNNRFKNFDLFVLDSLDKNKVSVKLENNKIIGDFDFTEEGYKYSEENWENFDKYNLKGTINGNTDYENKLEKLYISYEGEDLEKNKKNLNGSFSFGEQNIKFAYKFDGEGEKIDLNMSYDHDENYLPVNGKLNLSFSEKDKKFDYDNYKYNYFGDFKELLKVNINISGREISGETLLTDYLSISHNGWISKERFNLYNSFVAKSKMIKYLNSLEEDEEGYENNKIESLNGNLNIKSENVNNNKNLFIDSFVNLNSKEIFKFYMKNESRIQKKDNVYIEAPESYVELKDLMEK